MNLKYKKVFLFDLDGTITEPAEGITESFRYALSKFGIEETDEKKLLSFIGPPLYDSFRDGYGFSEEKAMEAIEYYRENYSKKGLFQCKLYDGIRELLEELKKRGKTVCLATSKPEPFARQLIAHFSLEPYFLYLAGSSMDERHSGKAEVVEYALSETAKRVSFRKEEVLMIGDRFYDVCGAGENGIETVGVLYGYGDREELMGAGAIGVIRHPMELFDYM